MNDLDNNSRSKGKKTLKEFIIYGIVGVTTTLVNIAIYQVLLFFKCHYTVANLIAIITCKIYGYLANKNIVFKSHCESIKELLKELTKFVFARGFTGLVDYFGLILCVEVFNADKVISKYVIQVIVIILNYVLGKYLVFKKKE